MKTTILSLALSAFALAAPHAAAETDLVLMWDGIKGASTSATLPGGIDAKSVGLGFASYTTTSKKKQKTDVVAQEISLSLPMGAAVAKLSELCVTGEVTKNVDLYVQRDFGTGKMTSIAKVTLSNVKVSFVSMQFAAGGEPTASISFSYTALQMEVCDMDEKGNSGQKEKMGYDFGNGKVL